MYFPKLPIFNSSETDFSSSQNFSTDSSTEIAAIFVVDNIEVTSQRPACTIHAGKSVMQPWCAWRNVGAQNS